MATVIKDVDGLLFVDKDGEMYGSPVTVTVRVTKDERGATMSMAAEDVGFMLTIPIEPIADIVKVVG